MKKSSISLSKILPFVIFVCALFIIVPSAHAGIGDWIEDAVEEVVDWTIRQALKLVGIDTDATCATPQVNKDFCLFCPMFKAIFNASSLLAGAVYRAFGSSLAQILLVFLGVSISLIILRNLGTMGAKDAKSIMNDVIKKVFLVLVIYTIIAHNFYSIINMTIVPVFETVMRFITRSDGPITCSNATGIIGFGGSMGGSSAGIPTSIGTMVVCGVQDIENKINLLFEYGEWAFCRGLGPDKVFYVIPRIICLVDGVILYIAGIFFMFTYPWIMADAVFQLGLAMSLLPFAITGYAFAGTKAYLGKVWNWLLHSMFVFLFMSILVTCVLEYIASVLSNATANVDPENIFLDGNKGLAFWGLNMVLIVFILAIAWTYMPTISNLAGNFASGTHIAAGAKIGNAIAGKMEDVAQKVGKKMGEAGLAVGGAALRGTRNLARNTARVSTAKFVNRFGKNNGSGGKSMRFMGMNFETKVDANTGKTILERSWRNPLNGRKHVRVYDRYGTIKKLYDSDGRQIRSDVKFRHSYVNEHLIDANGDMNMGAYNAILNSPLAQDPQYKKDIMAQLAVMAMRKKGREVGNYYKSRNVVYDPNDPNKIFVEQVDYDGKVTRFSMSVDAATGRTALTHEVEKSKVKNNYNIEKNVKKMGRNARKTNIFGTETETHVDQNGNDYYVTRRKKYLFFGDTIEKTYRHDATEVRTIKSQRYQDKVRRKAAKGKPNSHGGTTYNGLFHTYESHVDANGQVTYQERLRSGWNVKNYYRAAKTTLGIAVDIPKTVISGALYPVVHPIKSIKAIFHPARTFRNLGSDFSSYISQRGTDYANSWQTGDTVRMDTSKHTNTDGSEYTMDNEEFTVIQSVSHTTERDIFFSNGMVDMNINRDENGNETTTFKYSARAANGHRDIRDTIHENKVVDDKGIIAKELDPSQGGRQDMDLMYGINDLAQFNIQIAPGGNMRDTIVKNILAEGAKNRTNKLRTNLL